MPCPPERRLSSERALNGCKLSLGKPLTYVDLAEGLPPDPGAWGVAIALEGFSLGLHASVDA